MSPGSGGGGGLERVASGLPARAGRLRSLPIYHDFLHSQVARRRETRLASRGSASRASFPGRRSIIISQASSPASFFEKSAPSCSGSDGRAILGAQRRRDEFDTKRGGREGEGE